MDIFKITTKDEGKVFIIRPLPNIKNIQKSIVSYKTYFNKVEYRWDYRYMCLAMVNDELKIFDHFKRIHELMFSDGVPKMILMDSNKAIKMTVNIREGFPDPQLEIISDDKYRYDATEEKKQFIKNLLESSELDLLVALEEEKERISDRKIEIPYTIPAKQDIKVMSLKEIYEDDVILYQTTQNE